MSISDVSLKQALLDRRSIRVLQKDSRVTKEWLLPIVETIEYVPSAFNMQSGKMIILLDESHEKLWSIVEEALKAKIGEERMGPTREKLKGFSGGNGTILFFENMEVVEEMAGNFKSYAQHFNNWSEQGSGILQLAMWLSLTAEGLGASIQHYNPLIDEEVKKVFDVPEHWKLIGQMPFGKIDEVPEKRDVLPVDEFTLWR